MLSYWSDFEPNYWELRGATGTQSTRLQGETLSHRDYMEQGNVCGFHIQFSQGSKYEECHLSLP